MIKIQILFSFLIIFINTLDKKFLYSYNCICNNNNLVSSKQDSDFCSIGFQFLQSKSYSKAKTYFKKAIKQDRKKAEAYYGLALVYKEDKSARISTYFYLKKTINFDPNHIAAHFLLGQMDMEDNFPIPARKHFQKVIKLDFSFYQAYLKCALTFYNRRDYVTQRYQEYAKAIKYLELAEKRKKNYYDVLLEKSYCYYMLNELDKAKNLLIYISDHADKNFNKRFKAYVYLAWIYLKQKNYAKSWHSFSKALAAMNEQERELYQNLSFVLNKEEEIKYVSMDSISKKAFAEMYWNMRDSEPTTRINERLLEHYRRVSYSREYFSEGKYPWDKRGDIYIRFGEPDYRDSRELIAQEDISSPNNIEPFRRYDVELLEKVDMLRSQKSFRLKGITFGEDYGNNEAWIYFDLGFGMGSEFGFSTFHKSRQDFYFSPLKVPLKNYMDVEAALPYLPAKLAETVIAETPERYNFDYGGERLDFPFYVANFKGQQNKSRVEVYYGIQTSEIEFKQKENETHISLEVGLALFDSNWNRILTMNKDKIFQTKTPVSKSKDNLIIDINKFMADPGRYNFVFEVRDKISKKVGIYKTGINVDNFVTDSVRISDIELAQSITKGTKSEFSKRGLNIVPNPSKRYSKNQVMPIYYEIYNLTKNRGGRQTRYRIEISLLALDKTGNLFSEAISELGRLININKSKGKVTFVYDYEGTASEETMDLTLDISQLKEDEYQLQVKVTDLNSRMQAIKSQNFIITK